MGKMGHLWVQNWYLLNFLKIYSLEFSETAPDGKHQEMVLRDFEGKLLLCQNHSFWTFFQICLLGFSEIIPNDRY